MIAPQTQDGVARALEEFVSRAGIPLIVYIKTENYVTPETLARLHEQGAIFGVKYAVPRKNPMDDAYLEALIGAIGAERIVSGFGEPPALPHVLDYGLAGFTAGCVCIAPSLSMRVLRALKAGNRSEAQALLQPFLRLEALRERINAIRVLHQAVTDSGIADMGPILPTLSLPPIADHAEIKAAARELYEAEMAARAVPAQ
jgi:dihydrodipicolinate synthase/N-acetylneuraminate lyase